MKNSGFIVLNIKDILHKIILIALFLTPIFSISESLALIFGGLIDNSTALTPASIKAIKDIIFMLITFVGLIGIQKRRKINRIALLILIYILYTIVMAFLHQNNLIIFLVGLRWLIPIIMIVFLVYYVDKDLLTKIATVLGYLFLFHFILQITQLFFAEGWFGKNMFGLSARNPGIFFIPNTAAFFSILVLFFAMFHLKKLFLRRIIFLILPLSIFLTASGTGLVVYTIIMIIYSLREKYFKIIPVVLFITLIMFFLLYNTIEIIIGRSGLVEESFSTRVKIFSELFYTSKLFDYSNFGYGTSTGYLLANKLSLDLDMKATDSTYSSVIVNLGIINLFFFISIFVLAIIINFLNKKKETIIFIMIYLLFAFTTSIFEAYPMNLFFALLTAYYLRRSYKNENSRSS